MTEQERAAASAENYRRMRAELDRRLSLDPELRKLSKKIRNGKADFNDTFRYSEIVSKHLGEIMQENIGTITNPLGKEYVCKELLRDHYEAINDVLGEVQVALDEELGIHLNPVKAPRNDERIAQVAHALEDPTVKPETIRRRAKAPVVNTAMSMHDDYIRINAQKRNDLGLKPIIQRFGTDCCPWCSAVAGKYRFGEQPEDIFRRHDNCDCVIIYDTQVLRGKKTDSGRSKTWAEVDPKEVAAQGFQPRVLTQQQAAQLQENALGRLTLAGERDIIGSEGVNPMIHAIEQPIEQQHTGKGNPNAILTFDVPLNNRQQALLEHLPEYDSRVKVRKREVNMADLAALTAKTGHEFAMFTRKQERLIIRGNAVKVNISLDDAKALASDGYRWSGHTHPGDTLNCLMPSGGDKAVLEQFPQKTSVIYNSKGQYATFEKGV